MADTKTKYSQKEQMMLIEFVKAREDTTVHVKDIHDLCETLNLEFHDGNDVRRFAGVSSKIYKERQKLSSTSIADPAPNRTVEHSSAKTIKATALSRLVLCAKAIKRQADDFCSIVVEFEEEFEQGRKMMQKLTKVRKAVEEFQAG